MTFSTKRRDLFNVLEKCNFDAKKSVILTIFEKIGDISAEICLKSEFPVPGLQLGIPGLNSEEDGRYPGIDIIFLPTGCKV
jgi:hypothetical protein